MTPPERLLEDVLLRFLLVFRSLFGPEWYRLGQHHKSMSQKMELWKKTGELKAVLLFGVNKVSYSLWERATCLLLLLSQNNYLAY